MKVITLDVDNICFGMSCLFWADINEHSYMQKHAKLDANVVFEHAHSQQWCTSMQSWLDPSHVHENQVIRSVGHRKVLICPLCRKPQPNKSEDLIGLTASATETSTLRCMFYCRLEFLAIFQYTEEQIKSYIAALRNSQKPDLNKICSHSDRAPNWQSPPAVSAIVTASVTAHRESSTAPFSF